MYSEKIEAIFRSKNIRIGDTVRISKDGAEYVGLLMPHADLGDRNCAVLKLKSGYNVGIDLSKDAGVTLVQQGEKSAPSQSSEAPEPSSNFISILGCGGTIASRIEYKTGAAFPSFSPSELIASFPELANISPIRAKKLFSLLSEDLSPSHWQLMAGEIQSQIKDGSQGAILMHGTDVIGYSAAALSFMIQNPPVPIVFVGAQRSSDRGSSDNKMNLICAAQVAKSDIAHVGVCMHGTSSDDYCLFHLGTKVRKMHTSRRDAFKSINRLPLAKISYPEGKVEPLSQDLQTRKSNSGKTTYAFGMNENVALVYAHPGIKPEFFEGLQSYDGVVIAGTGMGHAPTNAFNDPKSKSVVPAITQLIESGIVVAMAPQAIYGRLNMNVYTAGRILIEAGVIGNNCDWLPETAYVKLMWALGQTKDPKSAKELMLANIAGELTQSTLIEE